MCLSQYLSNSLAALRRELGCTWFVESCRWIASGIEGFFRAQANQTAFVRPLEQQCALWARLVEGATGGAAGPRSPQAPVATAPKYPNGAARNLELAPDFDPDFFGLVEALQREGPHAHELDAQLGGQIA